MKKPGILFIQNTLRPGGAEMFVLRLAKYLSNEFNIYIYSCFPEQDSPEFIEQFKSELEFEFLPEAPEVGKGKSWFFWKINALAALIGYKGVYVKLVARERRNHFSRELNRRNIKLVNSSSAHSDNVAVNFFKKHFGIPAVLSIHSAYNKENWGTDSKTTESFADSVESTLRGADALLYTADHNTDIFEHIPPSEEQVVEKVYLGYEPKTVTTNRADMGWPEDAFVVSMMARGIPEKGWQQAIDAFQQLLQVKPNSLLVLIHTDTDHISELRNAYGNMPSIVFAGFVTDPSAILSNSDCTILPSHYPESLPYAITESLAYGIPVFSTEVAEIPQMIRTEDGLAGGIIPFNEDGVADPDQLAKELILAATEPAHLLHLKANADKAFKKFSMQHCGGRYLKLFQHLIARND